MFILWLRRVSILLSFDRPEMLSNFKKGRPEMLITRDAYHWGFTVVQNPLLGQEATTHKILYCTVCIRDRDGHALPGRLLRYSVPEYGDTRNIFEEHSSQNKPTHDVKPTPAQPETYRSPTTQLDPREGRRFASCLPQ